ncbi:thioester oxidase [Clostridia bacterium]|nr:thioester oxidase [Clostridia bacterium]
MDQRNAGIRDLIHAGRTFMQLDYDVVKESDQQKRLPQPPLCKPAMGGAITPLPTNFDGIIEHGSYLELLNIRRSERRYSAQPLTIAQLAFLLWSTQGIQSIRGNNYATMRPVPSGGARHEFETYFVAATDGVIGLDAGLYHYLPIDNAIEYIHSAEGQTVSELLAGQTWADKAPVTFYWSCVAYRAEWRYSNMSHRVALIDLGHIGQNFMLSAAALGIGSCCIAAYDQKKCDEFIGLDGDEEYTVYTCAVGYVDGKTNA